MFDYNRYTQCPLPRLNYRFSAVDMIVCVCVCVNTKMTPDSWNYSDTSANEWPC